MPSVPTTWNRASERLVAWDIAHEPTAPLSSSIAITIESAAWRGKKKESKANESKATTINDRGTKPNARSSPMHMLIRSTTYRGRS
jgi:hypothetical protein